MQSHFMDGMDGTNLKQPILDYMMQVLETEDTNDEEIQDSVLNYFEYHDGTIEDEIRSLKRSLDDQKRKNRK